MFDVIVSTMEVLLKGRFLLDLGLQSTIEGNLRFSIFNDSFPCLNHPKNN